MKTHEHALLSLGYGAVLAASAGHGLLDPAIYVSALIGGELIDFIDHPLYQLIFARNDPVVKEARSKYKQEGFNSAKEYLFQKEDERRFNKLRLHNVFSLTIIVLTAIFTSLYMPGTVYPFVMLGAFILHMLTDIYGDYKLLGHFDNWLWVLPPKAIGRIGKMGRKLIWLVILWWVSVILGFFFVSFRVAWQLYQPSTYWGLVREASNLITIQLNAGNGNGLTSTTTSGQLWLAYGPLLFLLIYFSLMFLLIIAGTHKLNLEISPDHRGQRPRFSTGSIRVIWDSIRGRHPKKQRKIETILLAMQTDQAVWILILTLLIASLLLIENALHASIEVILYTPVVCALVFGTLVHSTIGEYGGVQGVLLATFLNLIFTEPTSSFRWPYYYGYFLFLAACGAWILGLIGGIILRDKKRLSLISFVIQVRFKENGRNDIWYYNVLDAAHNGLLDGYKNAHLSLYGDLYRDLEVIHTPADFVVAPQSGSPALSGEYYHLMIQDDTVPLLQDMAYVLCKNRLTSSNNTLGKFGLLPVLPRTRMIVHDTKDVDIYWKQGNYLWDRSNQMFSIPSCENADAWLKPNTYLGLVKTWGEYFDNLVTKKSTFRTDLYLFATPNDPFSMTFCGLSRTVTSTKEYSTLETEAYTSEVICSLVKLINPIPCIKTLECQSARIIYPSFSFDDRKTIEEITQSAIFPTGVHSCYSRESADLLTKALGLIPDVNKNRNMMSDLRRRFIVLAGQLGLSFPIIFSYVLNQLTSSSISQFIANFLKGLLPPL